MDIEDVVHIHNAILLSHKRNEIMPFATTRLDLEIIVLSEADRERQTSCTITYMWSLKKGYRSSHCGPVGYESDVVSVRMWVSSLPGLAQWLRIQHCLKLQHWSQMQLGSGVAVAVV